MTPFKIQNTDGQINVSETDQEMTKTDKYPCNSVVLVYFGHLSVSFGDVDYSQFLIITNFTSAFKRTMRNYETLFE